MTKLTNFPSSSSFHQIHEEMCTTDETRRDEHLACRSNSRFSNPSTRDEMCATPTRARREDEAIEEKERKCKFTSAFKRKFPPIFAYFIILYLVMWDSDWVRHGGTDARRVLGGAEKKSESERASERKENINKWKREKRTWRREKHSHAQKLRSIFLPFRERMKGRRESEKQLKRRQSKWKSNAGKCNERARRPLILILCLHPRSSVTFDDLCCVTMKASRLSFSRGSPVQDISALSLSRFAYRTETGKNEKFSKISSSSLKSDASAKTSS